MDRRRERWRRAEERDRYARNHTNCVQQRNTKPQTIVPLPRTTSDTQLPKSRMNTWVPTVLKKNSGLSSSWVGARRSSGRSPASSWVGRTAGCARTSAPLHGGLHHWRLRTESHSGAFLAADSSVAQGSWRQRHWCSSRVARSARRAGGVAACRAPGASHLLSMSLTRPLMRPR